MEVKGVKLRASTTSEEHHKLEFIDCPKKEIMMNILKIVSLQLPKDYRLKKIKIIKNDNKGNYSYQQQQTSKAIPNLNSL